MKVRVLSTAPQAFRAAPLWFGGDAARRFYTEAASASVTMAGVPGFFRPKSPFSFSPFAADQTLSYYDTGPLAETLQELVDFDFLNDHGPRLSVGAVDIETGNFAYFDSATIRIEPEHIMASRALPPGFPPIEIAGRQYWDGGLVSNTPLQYVMENAGTDPVCIFQVDLFSARGAAPTDLTSVAQRQKDIQYSSRTRLTTDRYRHLHDIRAAADRLRAKLPDTLLGDPDLEVLCQAGPGCATTLVHLIHRKEKFETQSKGYEFSRLTMSEHWAAGRSDVLAALLLYRLIYTLLPFVIASTALGILWVLTQKKTVTGAASMTHRMIRPIIPPIAAGVAFSAGLIMLVSGSLPADTGRLGALRDILPLPFIEASHLIGSVVGLLLIVIARGLFLRRYRAWLVAMMLMACGIAVSLAKGLDWEEAAWMVVTLSLLAMFRSAFYRVDAASVFRLSTAWVLDVLAVLGFTFWVGLFAYSHVEYRDTMWWQFALQGDVSRFLRASLAVAVLFVVIGFNSLLSGRGNPVAAQPIPDAVRKLFAESPDAEACIALSGDKAFLVEDDQSAFLTYADTGHSLIAKGDPVGESEAGKRLIWRLREEADKVGKRCAFYSVSPTFLPTYLDLGLSILKIGEVGRVDLQVFTMDGSKRKDFRHAMSRARREGFEFAVIPAADLAAVLPALRRISDGWLADKQGEEKGFALGSFDEDYLKNFDHAVLRKADTGQIIAFANLFQGAGKHALSLDLMRYDKSGGNFAMDALFGELLLWGKAQGFRWFSLGAAPFSGIEGRQLASLWNRVGEFVYEHGERFYNFEGLRGFKEKFDPVWTPNYLASPGGLAAPRILYEVNILISGGLKGLIK